MIEKFKNFIDTQKQLEDIKTDLNECVGEKVEVFYIDEFEKGEITQISFITNTIFIMLTHTYLDDYNNEDYSNYYRHVITAVKFEDIDDRVIFKENV